MARSLPWSRRPMSPSPLLRAFLLVGLALGLAPLTAQQTSAPAWPDQQKLEQILGRKALRIEDEQVLHFYGWRRNVPIVWQERPVDVFEGISFRTSFQQRGEECLVGCVWLLFADEVLPVAAELTAGGLRIASILPRFPGAKPQPFELRCFGEGDEFELGGPIARAQAGIVKLRELVAVPPDGLPAPAHVGPSAVDERALEQRFSCKAEVKDGVAWFRFVGPVGLAGGPPSSRLGIAVSASFGGTDAAGRVRLDWSAERRGLGALLRDLDARGFRLESLVAAAPGFDDGLVQLTAVADGPTAKLAEHVAALLQQVKTRAAGPAPVAFTKPGCPEVLGLANGALADGWRSDATKPAGPRRATWTVAKGDAPVATMTDPGQADDKTFNLLWTDKVRFRDGRLVLRMHADQGRIDQGGGLIWRVQDADNYYVTRFNPLEQDFRVYRVVKGVREQLLAFGDLQYRGAEWFTLEVEHRGNHIVCTLNGRETLTVDDATFPAEGGVGVWSKADSQCSLGGVWVDAASSR